MSTNIKYINGLVASNLVPTIMAVSSGKAFGEDKLDLLYLTVTVGTVIGAVVSSLNFQFRTMTRDRDKLTILTTLLLTTGLIASIVGFHLVRGNFNPYSAYQLPRNIREQQPANGSGVFRHHFFADFIPGLILMSQSLLCMLVNFELMHRAKRKFNYGEASVVSQLVAAAYSAWAFNTYFNYTGAGPFKISLTNQIVLNLGVIFAGIALVPCYLIISGPQPIIRYALLALSGSLSFYIITNMITDTQIGDPFTWLISYIFAAHQRLSLFSLWTAMTMGAISFSTSWSRLVGHTNSYARKVFHGAVSVVFMTGYIQDLEFTEFAAGGMVYIMIVLETIRSWNLWPMGKHLEQVCRGLRGNWDNRYLTLSHIYLLVGTMLPLWILPTDMSYNKLILSSGLISVGVGDTAAAIIGSQFGTKNLISLKSGKTVEGFVGNVGAMVVFQLIWAGYPGLIEQFSFVTAALGTAFFELTSSDCDNLILPLVMIMSLLLL